MESYWFAEFFIFFLFDWFFEIVWTHALYTRVKSHVVLFSFSFKMNTHLDLNFRKVHEALSKDDLIYLKSVYEKFHGILHSLNFLCVSERHLLIDKLRGKEYELYIPAISRQTKDVYALR